jgi:hypothetical protein
MPSVSIFFRTKSSLIELKRNGIELEFNNAIQLYEKRKYLDLRVVIIN